MNIRKFIVCCLSIISICSITSSYVYAENDFEDDYSFTNTPRPSISMFSSEELSEEAIEKSIELYNNFLAVDPELFYYTEEGIGALSYLAFPTDEELLYLKTKAAEITDDCESETEKIYAVAKYMAQNICYDHDYYTHNSKEWYDVNLDPYDVLTNESTICDGYARTTATLLQLSGVPCIYVLSPNHAWNMAYNGERWILFDTTWISNGILEYGVLNKSDSFSMDWYDFSLEQANTCKNHLIEELPLSIYQGELIKFPEHTAASDIEIPASVQAVLSPVFFPEKITTLKIPESVSSIDRFRFEFSDIETVYYNGTEQEFKNIVIGDYNAGITNCSNIIYADNAAKPYIITQPVSTFTAVGEAVSVSLTAACANSDITYQWYQNDTASVTGGTLIEGAVSCDYIYTPSTAGKIYFYAEVISKDSSVSGQQEVRTTSIPVSVEVFKEMPAEIKQIGMAARYIRFEECDEAYIDGSGEITGTIYDKSSAIYISKGITHIPDLYYGYTLRFKENIWVEEGNPYYFSDDYGVLYDKINSSLLMFPAYSKTLDYTVADGTKSIDLSGIICFDLETLYILSSVETMTGYFSSMRDLKEISVETSNKNFYIDEYGALIDKIEHRVIKYPSNRASISEYIMPEDIIAVDPYAFSYGNFKEITLSPKLKVIGECAFYECDNIRKYYIPASVEQIGEGAFEYNPKLTDIYFFGNVPEIGEDAFGYNSSSLPTIHYAEGTDWYGPTWEDEYGKTYNAIAFDPDIVLSSKACGDNALWEIKDGVLTISGKGNMWDYVYDDEFPWKSQSETITEVVVGEGITRIGAYCFSDLKNVTKVLLPRSLKSIGERAFIYCRSLARIDIPRNVDEIGSMAFAFSNNTLKSAYFYGDVPTNIDDTIFTSAATDFTIYYIDGKFGWEEPTWMGYKTAQFISDEKAYITGNITSYGESSGVTTVKLLKEEKEIDSVTIAGNNGTYVFKDVAEGKYTITISKAHHVTCKYTVVVNGEDVVQNVEIQLFGDVNEDGYISETDTLLLKQYFAGYPVMINETLADVNADVSVTRADTMILARHLVGWEGYDLPYIIEN